MQIISEPYSVINWDDITIEKHRGETGYAWSRTFKTENIRIMMVEYSTGFKADHWCCRGHIMHLLEGEMKIELKDGSVLRLLKGMSCCFSDSKATAHKLSTAKGAFIMVID